VHELFGGIDRIERPASATPDLEWEASRRTPELSGCRPMPARMIVLRGARSHAHFGHWHTATGSIWCGIDIWRR
jgi:hypothetical protein